jgi:hypothetical protein
MLVGADFIPRCLNLMRNQALDDRIIIDVNLD